MNTEILAALVLYGALFGDARILWLLATAILVFLTFKPGARCFSEDTRLLLSDGRVVPITSVVKGMRVVTTGGRIDRVAVVQKHAPAPVVLLRFHAADGRILETTPDHYIVTLRGLVVASDVRETTDHLQRIDGTWVPITSVERICTTAPTFNVWLESSPYVCVNGLVATPCCKVSPLVDLCNDAGLLPWLTVPFRYAVMTS